MKKNSYHHELVDAQGTLHLPATGELRIVSLVPSITELLFALGLGEHIVGRTAYCIHPAEKVAAIRPIGGTKVVNMPRISALNATHLIVNIDENPKEIVEELAALIPNIIVTHPLTVRDNLALYRLLGGIFGRQAQAENLCLAFEQAYHALQQAAQALPKRQVLYFIWKAPWMGISHETYIADMLRLVNWELAFSSENMRYPVLNLDAELLEKTDLFLFSSEPYHFKASDLLEFENDFSKVPRACLQLVDGEMLSWYGSRAIQGMQYLQEVALKFTAPTF